MIIKLLERGALVFALAVISPMFGTNLFAEIIITDQKTKEIVEGILPRSLVPYSVEFQLSFTEYEESGTITSLAKVNTRVPLFNSDQFSTEFAPLQISQRGDDRKFQLFQTLSYDGEKFTRAIERQGYENDIYNVREASIFDRPDAWFGMLVYAGGKGFILSQVFSNLAQCKLVDLSRYEGSTKIKIVSTATKDGFQITLSSGDLVEQFDIGTAGVAPYLRSHIISNNKTVDPEKLTGEIYRIDKFKIVNGFYLPTSAQHLTVTEGKSIYRHVMEIDGVKINAVPKDSLSELFAFRFDDKWVLEDKRLNVRINLRDIGDSSIK